MALNPQIIGQTMPHGFAGCYARQPDMIVNTRPAGGEANIPFGTPLKYDASKNVIPFSGTGTTAAQFVGVAAAEIKSALTYLDPASGEFAPGEPVGVFQRGSINVKCYGTTAPALGGAVYVLLNETETAGLADVPVGSFTAMADGTTAANTVQLTNCQWGGPADADGVAELVILTRNLA